MSRAVGSVRGWLVGGVCTGVLLSTLWNAPAVWLTAAIEQGSEGRMAFHTVEGTVWSGSAQWTLTGGKGSADAATLPRRIQWHLQPLWNGLQVDVHLECCLPQAARLTVLPRWGGASVRVDDGLSQWPALWLTGLGTPWNTIRAEGQLALSTSGLAVEWVWGRMTLTGSAQLDALNMASRLSTLRPMGSYRLRLQGGDSPSLALETLEGALQLSGKGQWVGSKLRFSGEASAAPERLDTLSNLLNIIGRRNGDRAIITLG